MHITVVHLISKDKAASFSHMSMEISVNLKVSFLMFMQNSLLHRINRRVIHWIWQLVHSV